MLRGFCSLLPRYKRPNFNPDDGSYGRNLRTVTRSGLRFKSVARGWSPGDQFIGSYRPVTLNFVVISDLQIFFTPRLSSKKKSS